MALLILSILLIVCSIVGIGLWELLESDEERKHE